MLKILDISLIPLILSLLTNIKSTKVLSAQKKCGDPECETSMSRVLAIKDYTGPDCRYLSFKGGEEIMVYFKLSRKREDLWAGSKGKEFGYFPMDAIQTEEVFVTEEIEVPTKETDFLCLDGGEYVFENEDSIFNQPAEENEYVSLYPDGKGSDFNMPDDEIMKLPDTSIQTEYKESFIDSSEGDHKAEDIHPLETLYHGDSKLRHSKTDQDESSQQEDPITQALNPVPTQSTWIVSGIAGWLGLGREENKEAVGKSSQISEQITFRRRKIAITDNADFKKQPEESEIEPHSWFQSTLTDLLHSGDEKSGLGLLYKDSNPGIHSRSNIASSTRHHGRTVASETRKDRHSDSELYGSNWFDILTFGYTQKNEEQLANGEVDQNEDPLPPNIQSVSVDNGLREAAVEEMLYDEQGKYLRKNIELTVESVVDEEQEKEKYCEQITSPDVTDTEVPLGNEHSDFMNAEASSFSIEFAEKLKSSSTEQDSVSGNQIIENTQESERIKSQSGLYETIYNSIIDFNKVTSDNRLGHESPAIQSSILDQLLSFHSINNFVPIDTQITGEKNQKGSKKHQSFFSIRYFTNILDFQGFRAKENADTLEIDLKSNEESIQPKSSDAALSTDKENKKQLLLYQNIIEKELENQYTDTSQENILLFSSAGKDSEKIKETIQDSELVEFNKPHLQLANSKLKSCLSYQCIQITNYGQHKDQTWKSLEIQGHFNPEDKNIVHVLEAKKQSLLEVENVADSLPEQQDFPGEDIYSYEESVVMKQNRDAGKIAGPDKIEQVENSLLQVSETSVERISKKLSETMQEKDKSSQETREKLFFKELEEPLRDFSQCKDIPDDNEIPIGVLDNGKSVIKGGREETLLERRLVIEKSGIKGTNREQEAKNTEVDFNEYSSNDATDIKASYVYNQKEEEGVAENARKVAQSPFSISSSQDSVIHSEEKYSKAEQLQPLACLRHYKDLFNFQSFPDKTKNSLQEIERTKVENSQPKGSVESLQKNKDIEKKSRLHQNIAKEANLKEDIFNKDIFLLSSAMQNNADSANVTKDAQLLSETFFLSSEEHFSECIIDPLFQNQKACEKNIDQPHKTSELQLNPQRSTQQYKSVKRVSISRKQYINEIKHLYLKGLGERTPVICYNDVKKKIELSDPLASLQLPSEKHINNNIQEDVTDSCKENEFIGVKNVANMSPGTIKDFPVSYNEDYQLSKSITKEDMNHFSQERAKVQMHVSKQILESNDNQQDAKKIQTTDKYPNILKQQGLSPFIAGQELLQCEEEFYGHVKHKLHFVTHSVQKKYCQDPHMQIGEKSNEANRSGTIEEYSDNAQSCDFSSVAKTNDGYAPEEQTILHYPNSHTFSKKSTHLPHMSESLTYPKEDKLKSEQKALASHVDQSDSENSIITSIRPDKKHINQVEYATKTYLTPNLEGKEFRILAHHRKKDGILNIEDTESEFQHHIVPLMLSEVASQKKTKGSLITDYNNLLLKKHGQSDTSTSEDLLQHVDIQSEASKSDLSITPSKLFSDEIPHHLEPTDHIRDHTPVYTKGSLDIHRLAVDPNDETFTQNRTICYKNLNHVDKLTIYGHVKVKQEKSQKDKKSEKDIVHMNKNGRSDKKGESVTRNIFDKTSCYFGKLYQKINDNEDSTKHKSNKNIKAERHKAEYAYEQMKYECQGVNDFCYLNDKIMQLESQREICSLTQKKPITADSGKDNRKTDTLPILETGSAFQKAVQNGKLITDRGLDLKDASASRRFQEFNLKLTEESKKILQASMCDRYELQQLQQDFEKHQYNIFLSPCEDIYKERKQVTTLVEHEHKLNTGHEKCMKTKMHLLPGVQDLMWDIRNNCGGQKTESDNGKLPGNALKEKHPLNSNKEPNSDQHSEKNTPPANTKEKLNTSGKNDLNRQDVKEKVQGNNLMNQNCTTGNESKWLLQITLHLNEFCAIITSVVSSMISISKKVVSSLPENMRPGPDLYGFPWEIVICGTVVAIFTIILVLCRSYKSVRSRLYLGREKQLVNKVAELVEDKCKVLEKLSLCKKEYAELENTLKDGSFLQESAIASNIKTAYEELNNSNSALKNEIECLEKELKEEKSKRSEQDDLVAEIQKRVASLENEAKSIQLQVAEAKTTLKVYEINRERLKTSLQDAVEENSHLQESEKQLLQEAEGWDERFSELNEQTKMFESSQTNMEEALKNKESQVKSLTDCLLRMKDWSCATGDRDSTDDNHGDNDTKSEAENRQHLDDPEKETVKKLIYAAKLNACLKSLETERNQIYSKLTDEKKAEEELAERIERLQKEHVILQSENTEFESDVQKLQQKLKVMTELYQENEMNLHRKLTVEEKERLQKEEKLSKADKKINHAAEELNAYRQRAKDLEEELERTVRSYENQIMSHEKKAHDNWLTARAAERQLNDMRKENLHSRQKLTEAEFKYDLLEKDPYAHDDTATAFGRDQSPYGPSPMGRPSSETRAFLSPPTLLEGPLRLSPVLPGRGGRGSRGLGNPGTPEVGNERGELNTNRLSDPHRPPSDTGSLSPPWDRDHRVILPHSGHLYSEQSLPPRRPERFHSNPLNSGRLSGPAELRGYNMHSVDKTDGLSPENNLRMDLSGNEIRGHSNGSNMLNIPDQSVPPENEPLGPGIVPPPLPFLRAPLMSVDPRGSFMRRGPPFLPVPPSSVYGAQEYFPRDFAGLPRPLLPMRGPFPMRPFSQYPPPPRPGFFPPPPPPPPDNRNELPAELTQLSTVSSTDHQESQQETG